MQPELTALSLNSMKQKLQKAVDKERLKNRTFKN